MKKKELIFLVAEEVQRQAPTQDGLKAVHPQVIEKEIATAYEQAITQFFLDPNLQTEFDLDYFSKSYDTPLMENPTTKELYVVLPVSPMPLPKGMGIRLVKPKDSSVSIARISEAEFINLRNLEAFCCSPTPFCYSDISGKKIIFQVNRPEYRVMDNITVKIIQGFDSYGYDDEINIPGGAYQVSQMVMKNMGIRVTDNVNDDVK